MSNSTSEFWQVDGVSLNTYAWNIESWGSDRQAPPPVRGSNIRVPFRAGTVWMPKVPDERTMTLAMWVQGSDTNGFMPKTQSQDAQFRANWHTLRSLLWQPYRQIALSKYVVYPDGTLNLVTAQAQYAGGLSPDMTGSARAAFTVDLTLADPFFYGQTIAQPVANRTSFTAVGDARTTRMSITVPGARTTPRIALDITGSDDPYVQYNGTINSGETLTLDCNQSIATVNGSVRTGLVINDNAPQWLYLDPGVNNVIVNGSATINYQPAFL